MLKQTDNKTLIAELYRIDKEGGKLNFRERNILNMHKKKASKLKKSVNAATSRIVNLARVKITSAELKQNFNHEDSDLFIKDYTNGRR